MINLLIRRDIRLCESPEHRRKRQGKVAKTFLCVTQNNPLVQLSTLRRIWMRNDLYCPRNCNPKFSPEGTEIMDETLLLRFNNTLWG